MGAMFFLPFPTSPLGAPQFPCIPLPARFRPSVEKSGTTLTSQLGQSNPPGAVLGSALPAPNFGRWEVPSASGRLILGPPQTEQAAPDVRHHGWAGLEAGSGHANTQPASLYASIPISRRARPTPQAPLTLNLLPVSSVIGLHAPFCNCLSLRHFKTLRRARLPI